MWGIFVVYLQFGLGSLNWLDPQLLRQLREIDHDVADLFPYLG
jgi:hypothetical protein